MSFTVDARLGVVREEPKGEDEVVDNQTVLLSVIVPVYNVAPYISGCLDSVVEATKNLVAIRPDVKVEVICVDDGSTDGSGEILDGYCENVEERGGTGRRNCMFVAIHQDNRGVSAARNAALEVTTGEWVMMLDGDDTWNSDLLVRLFEKIDANPICEAVGFGMVKVDEKGRDLGTFGSESVSAVTTGDGVLLDGRGPMSHFIWSSCDKIFRRSAIDRMHLRYRVGMRLSEDSFFAHKFMAQAGVVVLAPEIKGYRYLMRAGSAIHTQDSKLPQNPFDVFLELLELWRRIRTPGLKLRLQLMAADLPSLGKQENFTTEVRASAIDFLLHAPEFNRKVIPFLFFHGSFKGRIFAFIYLLSPRMLKRMILMKL